MQNFPIEFTLLNGGRFISRGRGMHPVRVIDSDELIYVVSGRLAIFEDNLPFHLNAGEWMILRKDRKHGGLERYPGNLSFYWLHFIDRNGFLDDLPRTGRAVRQERMASYCQNFIAEQQEQECDREALELIFRLIVRELLRSEDIASCRGKASALALAARQMIDLRFRENLTLETLGRELHCNSEYLGRVYKIEYGKTVTATINTLRVEHAARLLESTSMSVKEIIQDSGFNDPAYFRRCFYGRYAISPRKFRKRWTLGHFNSC